ncbi:hypothetical protein HPP92_007707 [Vanilla planifolia]|uniref:Subtilisin-like protease n=1 Tax=Vanilla planifolia TaxID=51239 RepID=A0A835RKR5_VANPL|nr:hypothetical protein HPP92_007707 [Vanilla planifolia]
MIRKLHLLFLLFLHQLFLSTLLCSAFSRDQAQVFIVYMGEHRGTATAQEIHGHHLSLLLSVKESEEKARQSILYSYRNSINGFAALLTEEEAASIAGRSSLHTTRSWEFIGKEENPSGSQMDWLTEKAAFGKDVIVGMLDSGIWPESKSFVDEGMGPVPKRWKGICEEGDAFSSSQCNRILFNLRQSGSDVDLCVATKGWPVMLAFGWPLVHELITEPLATHLLNTSYAYRSARDHDGHGTHTASIVAGRSVSRVSSLGGFAAGTAVGGAPLARLAVYKVCWPIPGPNPNIENTCFNADMLAAIDDAIGDGVDVLSISIGANGVPRSYSADSIAIGTLHAAKRGIVSICSAGNSGPDASTVVNLEPWVITVAASSIDRAFDAPITLGNAIVIQGQTVTPYKLKKNKQYSLIYAGDAEVAGTPKNVSGQCLPNSLAKDKVKGKVVLCLRGVGLRVEKGVEVKRAGGAAIILGNGLSSGDEIPVDAHVLPASAVSSHNVVAILSYIWSTVNPTASIGRATTVVGVSPAPSVTAFSSRGPNRLEPNLLKPDITAPGLNILAAWSEASSPTKLEEDHRHVRYNLLSGTSMSCPHVSATAALLKSVYPRWSSAAIRSALMTTASVSNNQGRPLIDASGGLAGPMAIGSGHLRPVHASDPGLVYEASYEDYLLFVCASTGTQMDPSFPCSNNPPRPSDLNYPSVTVTVPSNGTVTVWRSVSDVGGGSAKYVVSIVDPPGVAVEVQPKALLFTTIGETIRFRITITALKGNNRRKMGYETGSLTWSDGVHYVRSPIVVKLN